MTSPHPPSDLHDRLLVFDAHTDTLQRVLMDDVDIGRGRMALGIVALAIFVVSFSPAPLAL